MSEQVAERARQLGLKSLSAVELMCLSFGEDGRDVDDLTTISQRMLKAHRLPGLTKLEAGELHEKFGLDERLAMRLLAAIELGARSARSAGGTRETVSEPRAAEKLFEHLRGESREHFCVAFLNAKNGLISLQTIHIGTLNMSVVGPREVFREAVKQNAAGVILGHNHPSGDAEPSPEDISITRKLTEIGKMLDIQVLDHIIVGSHNCVSLSSRGLM